MDHILNQCQQNQSIVELCLHVQVNNTDALLFYTQFNFVQIALVPNYYRKIVPAEAYLLQRRFEHRKNTSNSASGE